MLPPVAACAPSIDRLLGVYGDALTTARTLPFLSRSPVDVRRLSKGTADPRRRKRIIVGPVVRYYVRRHVAGMLTQLVAGLDERWLETGCAPTAAERRLLRDRIAEQRNRIAPRAPWRVVLHYVPLVPAVAALLVAWLVQPVDRRPSGVDLLASLALVALLATHAVWIAMLAYPFGGDAARALLSGGEIDVGARSLLMSRAEALDTRERWVGLGREDAEELEQVVGAACGLAPLRRSRADLGLHFAHYAGTVGVAAVIAVGLALDEVGRPYLVLGAVGFVSYLAGLRALIAVARQRREHSRDVLAQARDGSVDAAPV